MDLITDDRGSTPIDQSLRILDCSFKIALINRVQISTFCNLNAKEKNQSAGEKTGKLRGKI